MAALMHSYFEDGGDVTSHTKTLLDAAEKAGLDKAEAEAWLDEGKGGDEVDKAVEWAYAKGIQGVPHFIINDRYEIGGAQDVEAVPGRVCQSPRALRKENVINALEVLVIWVSLDLLALLASSRLFPCSLWTNLSLAYFLS